MAQRERQAILIGTDPKPTEPSYSSFLTKLPPASRIGPPLVLGFNAQIIQLILLREALILSNGSELSLGICLAAWALFNGAGALMGGLLYRIRIDAGRFFAPLLACLPLLLALSVVGARVVRACVDLPGSEPLPMSIFAGLSVMVLAPATFVDGLLFFSLLEKLFGRKAGGQGTSLAYGAASLGALVGGMLFSLLLVVVMTPFHVAGSLLIVNALCLLFHRFDGANRKTRIRRISCGALLAVGTILLVSGAPLNRWSERLRWHVLQPGLEWIESTDTPYQNLAVLRYEDEYSLFANAHWLCSLRAGSASRTGDWERALFPNFAMLQPKACGPVLLIGGGFKGYLNDLLDYAPSTLYWVEYDQALVELAARYQIREERDAANSERVVFEETDGRLFVKSLPAASLDLILVDVPDPSNANTNRYYTKEFFEECRSALRSGGVLVLGLSSQPTFIGEYMLQRNGSVFASLRAVFPHVRITPGTFSYLAAGRIDARLTVDAEELIRRYRDRGIESGRFSPYLFYTYFEESAQEWIDALYERSLADGVFEPNLDDRPVAYLADSRLAASVTAPKTRDEKSGPGRSGSGNSGAGKPLFGKSGSGKSGSGKSGSGKLGSGQSGSGIHGSELSGHGEAGAGRTDFWETLLSGAATDDGFLLFSVLGALFLGGGALLCLLAGQRRFRVLHNGSRIALYFGLAFITGFSGIVFEVALLIAYQNHAGHLYSRMGVLIACYMAGLSAGALWRGGTGSPGASFSLALTFILLGGGGAIGLTAQHAGGIALESVSPALFASVLLLFGAAGGLSFRGVALALKDMGTPGGGLIYSFDILGTFLGGWMAGSRMIPYYGIRLTLITVSILLMTYCIMAWWCARQRF